MFDERESKKNVENAIKQVKETMNSKFYIFKDDFIKQAKQNGHPE